MMRRNSAPSARRASGLAGAPAEQDNHQLGERRLSHFPMRSIQKI